MNKKSMTVNKIVSTFKAFFYLVCQQLFFSPGISYCCSHTHVTAICIRRKDEKMLPLPPPWSPTHARRFGIFSLSLSLPKRCQSYQFFWSGGGGGVVARQGLFSCCAVVLASSFLSVNSWFQIQTCQIVVEWLMWPTIQQKNGPTTLSPGLKKA